MPGPLLLSPSPRANPSHTSVLDQLYGIQRYYYDWTRKFFLFGRDDLLKSLLVERPRCVLEIGCGTARNLIWLAQRLEDSKLIGLDASAAMLRTAQRKVASRGLDNRIRLEFGLAEQLSAEMFDSAPPPDAIFFSYSLSMIPSWREALRRALDLLAPGGSLWVVDFWDQRGFPEPLRQIFQFWLRLFAVRFLPQHLEVLDSLAAEQNCSITISSVGGSYAYRCRIHKPARKVRER